MLLPRLIRHHLRHGPDEEFYRMQATDAIAWLVRQGLPLTHGTRVLDLGCGSGILGHELLKLGCAVTFADEHNCLAPALTGAPFVAINLDRDALAGLGQFHGLICSNVLEHLAQPQRLITHTAPLVLAGGFFYLSWTNWLSPWGGHDFSPFHYLGPRLGPRLWDRWVGQPRKLEPYRNLYPTYIGTTLRWIRRSPSWHIRRVVPRYYPELAWVMSLPGLREFLAWNCAVLAERTTTAP